MPREAGAEPFHDFNEKIDAECYRPNAQDGNFELMSFNVGPTLAAWLERHDPETYRLIQAADRGHVAKTGHGNAMAQAYNHTILPLANSNEKRIQIAWGIADFRHRFGREPEGIWLAETAVDYETLCQMAKQGIKFTILAPWQAASGIDTTEPYRVFTCEGEAIVVFFFDHDLNMKISFDETQTINADYFASQILAPRVNWSKLQRGEPELTFVATDGEVYGHHKPGRDRFLQYLVKTAAPREGFDVVTLGCYFHAHPPLHEVHITDETSWSCFHGVRRWEDRDDCAGDQNDWKKRLREALNGLASRLDAAYQQIGARFARDPWEILERYIEVKLGTKTAADVIAAFGANPASPEGAALVTMMESQYYRQLMFTSCGFFFDDLDRIEPYNNVAFAAKALELARAAGVDDVEATFVNGLEAARSWRTGRTAKDIYLDIVSHR
ncbi:MAG: DUF3536 domain-containing protein [Chloroflexi bacterium]|nr:DUF3536 domain-containing protein [Chloroflexota bacterium]